MNGNKTRKILLPTRSLRPRWINLSEAVRTKTEGEIMKRLLTHIGAITQIMSVVLAVTTVLHAQETRTTTTDNARRQTRITVGGDAIVQAQPDTAIMTVSVVTQGRRAIDAQQENATKTDAVVRALKAAAGTGAEVKTSGYSLQPMRVYRENQPPTITGYEARNSVTVTTSDLTKLGNLIDTVAQAGANDVTGISFTLRQDRPARDRALQEATREAMNKAQVMAQALGGRVVGIAEVQEEGFIRPPQPVYQAEAFMAKRDAVTTPIEIGSLDISSRVQLVAIVEMNP
jgi:uncharacterized protein YggE